MYISYLYGVSVKSPFQQLISKSKIKAKDRTDSSVVALISQQIVKFGLQHSRVLQDSCSLKADLVGKLGSCGSQFSGADYWIIGDLSFPLQMADSLPGSPLIVQL